MYYLQNVLTTRLSRLCCWLVLGVLAGFTAAQAQPTGLCDSLRVSYHFSKAPCCWDFTFENWQSVQPTIPICRVTCDIIAPTGCVVGSASGPGYAVTSFTATKITWNFPSGSLPTGSNSGFIACFDNKSGTYGPKLVFTWYTCSAGSAPKVVCYDTVQFDCPPVQTPKDTCHTDSLNISTGWSHATNSVIAPGGYQTFWTVTSDPFPSTVEPRPAYVITKHPAWGGPLAGSNWISSNPSSQQYTNGKYVFQACFCIDSQPNAAANIRLIMDILADDTARVLVNGNFVGSVAGFVTPKHIDVNIASFLKAGRNCIELEVYNTGSVAMGVDVAGFITGVGIGIEKPNCCDPTGAVIGSKFWDQNCNGKWDSGEPGLSGWTITITNGTSTFTTTTDANGNYYFMNLPPGIWTVSEVNQPGWTQSAPATLTYTVNVTAGIVIANRDFGNCKQVQQDCFEIVNKKIECKPGPNGNVYNYCFQVKNNSPFVATTWSISSATGGISVAPTSGSFSPAVSPGGTSTTLCFTVSGPGAIPGASFNYVFTICGTDAAGLIRCCEERDSVRLPDCPKPKDCCDGFIKCFSNVSVGASVNGITNIKGLLCAGPAPIISASVTVIDCRINGSPVYGYFNPAPNSILGMGAGSVPDMHEVFFGPTGGTNLSGATPFNLSLRFPPMAPFTLTDNLSFCLRFRYTDINCRTCDTVICFKIKRTKIIIIGSGHFGTPDTKKMGSSIQSASGEAITGNLLANDSAAIQVTFPQAPFGLTYLGMEVMAQDSIVQITGANADAPYTFITLGGVAYGYFAARPGDVLNLGLKYNSTSGKNSLTHTFRFYYVVDGTGDTLQEDVDVVIRRENFQGGDKLGSEKSDVKNVKTYSVFIENANLSQESIAAITFTTQQGKEILAIGPEAKDSMEMATLHYNKIKWTYAVPRPIEPGQKMAPIYLTLSGSVGAETMLHFQTLNADGQVISEGDVTLSDPVSGIRQSGNDQGASSANMLRQNRPNPTSGSVTIEFSLANQESNVTLTVTDANGREVEQLINGKAMEAGNHAVWFNASSLPSGTYYYTLSTGSATETRAMQVVK